MKVPRLVENEQELADNCVHFYALEKSVDPEDYAFFAKRTKNIKRFVALALGNSYIFAPGAYVAYYGCSSVEQWKQIGDESLRTPGRKHLDHLFADKLVSEGHPAYGQLIESYNRFCSARNIVPSSSERSVSRSFWLLTENVESKGNNFPDDIPDNQHYPEGAALTVTVNAYERNQDARLACIAHYEQRHNCEICGFNFEETYGVWGKDYIQVHHLLPLSARGGKKYTVNPKTDLIPVCCNCHAMIHRRKGSILSPKELKGILKTNSKK